jgi:hypothetical protein
MMPFPLFFFSSLRLSTLSVASQVQDAAAMRFASALYSRFAQSNAAIRFSKHFSPRWN